MKHVKVKEIKNMLKSLEICCASATFDKTEISGISVEIGDVINLVSTDANILIKFELHLDSLINLKIAIFEKYGFKINGTCVIHFQKKDSKYGIQENYIQWESIIQKESNEALTDFPIEMFNLQILSKVAKIYNILKLTQNLKPSYQNNKNNPVFVLHDNMTLVIMPLHINYR